MSDKVPRSMIRKLESEDAFPLRALDGIREMRKYLDNLEDDALCRARELGASITEIADVMKLTRQTVYNRLRQLADLAKEDAAASEVGTSS